LKLVLVGVDENGDSSRVLDYTAWRSLTYLHQTT